ncbi:MAG: sphinganine-1-phosphate aldolase [Candidatus Poriferisodalaceae bacterium]|jgi:sphinganine-1-phosphate aldolase
MILGAGVSADDLRNEVSASRAGDTDWRAGRTFSLVYHHGDAELEELQHRVALEFLHDNALNPTAFPSLKRFERDVTDANAAMLHGEPRTGAMTAGGTDSIFHAVATSRDAARAEGRAATNVVLPHSADPAFAKAAHYLAVEERRVRLGPDMRADVEAMDAAADDGTFLLVGSAPCYPYGVIDDIEALGQVALGSNLLLHVDGCLGGWLLPWWEDLGHDVAPFDFRVPGVTSTSADLHKYGWMFKGASTVAYRSRDLLKHQFFVFNDWPGGMYGSPGAAGTRPGALFAGAWATIRHLGDDGYRRLAAEARSAFDIYRDAINAIDGLEVTASPEFSAFQFGPTAENVVDIDLGGVHTSMTEAGWHVDRQQCGLHLILFPRHLDVVEEFLSDLQTAVLSGRSGDGPEGTYGGL